MSGKSYIVFSDDFGEHPSSCQHIFRSLSPENQVLWVNTIGMRSPRFTIRDFEKILLKSKKMLSGLFEKKLEKKRNDVKHIYVCQPPMLPFMKLKAVRKINKYFVLKTVRENIKKLKIEAPIIVVTAPNACDYIGNFNEQRTVYYCVDDFTEWPGLEKALVQSMEGELIEKADLFVATSIDLVEKLKKRGKNASLLTHGVDVDFFRQEVSEEHVFLKKIPKPRVGYFGLFDARSDLKLIKSIAERMPHVSFVITGNVEVDISELEKKDNIYFTGSIPYDDLPAMAKGWDICMLPYVVNVLTNAIQPLKIKEYLATGKPVISTPIKEACNLKDHVIIAGTADEWEKGICANLNGISQNAMEKRLAFLNSESWKSKAERFFKVCLQTTPEKSI